MNPRRSFKGNREKKKKKKKAKQSKEIITIRTFHKSSICGRVFERES